MIRFGITADFICLPVLYYLQKNWISHPFQLVEQDSRQNCEHLLKGDLDVAFIAPVHLARYSGELKIFRDLAVFSRMQSGTTLLFFQEDLPSIERIAFMPPEDPYHQLARLVLTEVYEITAAWEGVKLPLSVSDALESHPACLYTGNQALEVYLQSDVQLDLVETWCDRIRGPYVHYLIATRKDFGEKKALEKIIQSLDLGLRNARKIAQEYASDHINDWDFYLDVVHNWYGYQTSAEVWDACLEYARFLYYYREIDYIPDFHYL